MNTPCPFCQHDLVKVRHDRRSQGEHTYECENFDCPLVGHVVYDDFHPGKCFLCLYDVVPKYAADVNAMIADDRPFLFHKTCMQQV